MFWALAMQIKQLLGLQSELLWHHQWKSLQKSTGPWGSIQKSSLFLAIILCSFSCLAPVKEQQRSNRKMLNPSQPVKKSKHLWHVVTMVQNSRKLRNLWRHFRQQRSDCSKKHIAVDQTEIIWRSEWNNRNEKRVSRTKVITRATTYLGFTRDIAWRPQQESTQQPSRQPKSKKSNTHSLTYIRKETKRKNNSENCRKKTSDDDHRNNQPQ